MDDILYNKSNYSSLEDISGGVQQIQGIQQDIANIFNMLATVYTGDGAAALEQARIEVNNMMEEALNNVANTQKQAIDQQDAMHAMDRANSLAF